MTGPTNIYKCPHCGTGKHLMSHVSYNDIGTVIWSDTYVDAPNRSDLSRVQKCGHCGKYFFIDGIQPVVLRDELYEEYGIGSSEAGTLDYRESLEAMRQFEGAALSEDQRLWLRYNLLYAYNDWRTREIAVVRKHLGELGDQLSGWRREWSDRLFEQLAECSSRVETEEDRRVFRENALALISHTSDDNLLFKAELYREMGEFDRCLELLAVIGDNHLTRQFRRAAEGGSREVFRVVLSNPN